MSNLCKSRFDQSRSLQALIQLASNFVVVVISSALAEYSDDFIGYFHSDDVILTNNQGRNHEHSLGEAKPMVGHNLSCLIEIGLMYI